MDSIRGNSIINSTIIAVNEAYCSDFQPMGFMVDKVVFVEGDVLKISKSGNLDFQKMSSVLLHNEFSTRFNLLGSAEVNEIVECGRTWKIDSLHFSFGYVHY